MSAGALRIGRHRHFLGVWSGSDTIRVCRGVRDSDGAFVIQSAWGPLMNAPSAATVLPAPIDAAPGEASADLACVFTVPGWMGRDVWQIDDQASPGTPGAFDGYSLRATDFLRHVGLVHGARASARLAATAVAAGARLATESPPNERDGAIRPCVVVNVGDCDVELVLAVDSLDDAKLLLSIGLGRGHGCYLSQLRDRYAIRVVPPAEFGLHLEVIA